MAALPNSTPFLAMPARRSFLWSLASLALTPKAKKLGKQAETVYRFLTPECEVRMSVQFFASSSIKSLRFRDHLANRAFCLSSNGEQDRNCLERFYGSIAIARYDFRSRTRLLIPLSVREHVRTIDHDSRLSPRLPFERVLEAEREVVSDIQAFGYNQDDTQQPASNAKPVALWCLLRQDLYLNDQATAFLIVHWKHTVDFITLVDVIPGDRTEVISD